MPILAVPRVRESKLEQLFERLDGTDTPLVVEGGVAEWRAVKLWTRARLNELIGCVSVDFKSSSCHQHPDFHQPALKDMFARTRTTFAEFFTALLDGPETERSRRLFTGDEQFLLRRRDGETRVDPELAPLLDDLQLSQLLPADRLFTAWAWFSGKGVRTWLHYDNNGCHNFNAQLLGRKRCQLFAPDELRQMAPFAVGSGNPAHNCSLLDVELPGVASELERLNQWQATLEQGDLLFIPAWWWHSFEHLGELNANVNVWWKPSLQRSNKTATRQAWLDAVGRAGIKVAAGSPEGELLRRIDAELVAAR